MPSAPVILYTSPFVPPEWLAAHGVQACRWLPALSAAAQAAGEGVCPFAAAVAGLDGAPPRAGLVLASTCDQLRRAPERIDREQAGRVFRMHVPATWNNPRARAYYRGELERLGRFLVACGGRAAEPGYLAACMSRFEWDRATLLRRRPNQSNRAHARDVEAFARQGRLPAGPEPEPKARDRVPLLLLGGPMTPDTGWLLDLFDEGGAWIAADGSETGERTWPAPFDGVRMQREPLDALVDAYYGGIPDVFRRPNTALYDWVRAACAKTRASGAVLLTHRWCDLWRAETGFLESLLEVPLLTLDVDGGESLRARTATRVQAFLEMLRAPSGAASGDSA